MAPGVDARRIIELLGRAAAEHPQVVKEPPRALFINFSGGSLNFELRGWTTQFEDWSQVRSDLSAAINSALAAQKISIR